jgi:hypothetical protein
LRITWLFVLMLWTFLMLLLLLSMSYCYFNVFMLLLPYRINWSCFFISEHTKDFDSLIGFVSFC